METTPRLCEGTSTINVIVVPSKFCLDCSYILDGLSVNRCPECGKAFDPADPVSYSSRSRWDQHKHAILRALLLFCVLFLFELPCYWIAWHAVGAVHAALVLLLILVSNALALATLVALRPRLTRGVLLFIALLFMPYHLYQAALFLMLQHEAHRIVAHMESEFARTGAYPSDLSSYAFAYGFSPERFALGRGDPMADGYSFRWYVTTPTTSHWYSRSGGWGYYPD